MSNIIVVGVDDSAAATLAAHKAAEIAGALGAELHVICAFGKYEVDTFNSGEEQFSVTSEDDSQRTAEAVAAGLRSMRPGLSIVPTASKGKPADALVGEADRLSARLVVVGNKRVQGPARVLGSIASSVVSHASCDVYVAQTHPRD